MVMAKGFALYDFAKFNKVVAINNFKRNAKQFLSIKIQI